MKGLKKLSKIVGLGLLSISLMACGNSKSSDGSKESNDKIKIGIIQYVEHVSLDNARAGFVDAIEDAGINAEYVIDNEQGDPSLTTTVPKKFESDEYKLVYAIATPAVQGAKTALPNKNIIYSAVSDPIGAGLIKSENEIENITGVSDYVDSEVQLKNFLKIYPEVKTIGVIYSTSEQNSTSQIERLKKACDNLNLKLESVGINNINDIPQAISSLSTKIDALYALTDNTVASAAPIVAENLLKYNIPSLSAEEGQVGKGLLMSEGVDYYKLGRQAGEMAVKIINGEDIKNIPAENSKHSVKRLNQKTAEALKLDLSIDELKDAVIEK